MNLGPELLITIGIQVLTAAATLVVALYRLSHLEKRHDALDAWVKEHDKECQVRARELGELAATTQAIKDVSGWFTPPHGYNRGPPK